MPGILIPYNLMTENQERNLLEIRVMELSDIGFKATAINMFEKKHGEFNLCKKNWMDILN